MSLPAHLKPPELLKPKRITYPDPTGDTATKNADRAGSDSFKKEKTWN